MIDEVETAPEADAPVEDAPAEDSSEDSA